MIAVTYARKSIDIWSTIVVGWRWVDWSAIASLATLAAVLVALIPIFLAWKRDRVMRRLVRVQIITHIVALENVFDWQSSQPGPFTVDEWMNAEIEALRGLMPSGHVLSRLEVEALIRSIGRLTALASVPGGYSAVDASSICRQLEGDLKGLS